MIRFLSRSPRMFSLEFSQNAAGLLPVVTSEPLLMAANRALRVSAAPPPLPWDGSARGGGGGPGGGGGGPHPPGALGGPSQAEATGPCRGGSDITLLESDNIVRYRSSPMVRS